MPKRTGRVKNCMKRLQLALRNWEFSKADTVLNMYILARFEAEEDILRIHEAQAFIALPYVLKEMAKD